MYIYCHSHCHCHKCRYVEACLPKSFIKSLIGRWFDILVVVLNSLNF